MAELKLEEFSAAEADCTQAIALDPGYVKVMLLADQSRLCYQCSCLYSTCTFAAAKNVAVWPALCIACLAETDILSSFTCTGCSRDRSSCEHEVTLTQTLLAPLQQYVLRLCLCTTLSTFFGWWVLLLMDPFISHLCLSNMKYQHLCTV